MEITLGKEYFDKEMKKPCLVIAEDDMLGFGVIYKGENAGITWLQAEKLGELKNN